MTVLLHVSLHTPRLEESLRFFTDGLSLAVKERPPLVIPGFWLSAGGVEIHLNGRRVDEAPAEPVVPVTRPRHICLGVEDLVRAETTLASLGYPCTRSGSLSVPQSWVVEPSGSAVELQQI